MNITKQGILLGLGSGLFWAISGIFYEELYREFASVNIFTINIIVFFSIEFTSLIIIFLYLYSNNKITFSINKQFLSRIVPGVIGGPMAMLLYIYSIQEIGIAYTSVFSICYPVIVVVLSVVYLKDKLSLKIIFHLLIIIFLISILLNTNYKNNLDLYKVLLPLLCAFFWAVEIILSTNLMKSYSSDYVYFYRQAGSSLGYLLILIYQFISKKNFGETSDNILTLLTDFSFFFIELILLISSALSYFLYYKTIDILGPVKAVVLNITYSVWAVLIGGLFFKQDISLTLLFVSVLIVINIYFIIRKKN